MKKNMYPRTILFVSLTLLSLTGWGQVISENFNESTTAATTGGIGMPSGYSTGNYVLTSGTWALTNAIFNNNSSNYHSSPSALQLRSATGSQAVSPTIATGGIGTLTFWAALTSGSGTSLQVNISVNGGGYTPVTGSPFSLTTTTTQFSVPINNSGSNIQLQFYRTSGTVVIDDVITTAVACTPPSITTQPSTSAQTICSGGTFSPTSLTVVTSASPTTYQWYSNATNSNSGGTLISGATSASYSLPSTAGTVYYYCIVTASSCPASSAVSGAITVNTGPSITTQPSTAGQTICQGGTATALTIGATGTSLTYQWYSNAVNNNSTGTLISGAISANYTPSSASAGTTYYYCKVSGASPCAAATSTVSGAIIVNPSPVIITQPSAATVNAFASASTSFNFITSASSPTYQWQYSITSVGGYANVANSTPTGITYSNQTTATLGVATTSTTPAGSSYYYQCVVTAGGCSTTTSSAQMTVNNYCASQAGSSNGGDGITSVVFNTINNTAIRNLNPGYNDYTGISTNLIRTSAYTLAVKINTQGSGTTYTNYAKAWIDWNQDGVFNTTDGTLTPGGEEYNLGTVTSSTNTGVTSSLTPSITVPNAALTGNTRMRIITKYNAIPTSCLTSFDGETEDYTINVMAACTSPNAIAFVTAPSSVVQDATMTAVTVKAYCTSTGATATSYTGNITLAASGTGCGYASQTVAAVNGVATFNNIVFSRSAQTGITMTASASGFSNVVSGTFNVTAPSGIPTNTTIINENFDGSTPTWPYSSSTVSNGTTSGSPFVGLKDYTTNPYGNSTFKKSLVKSHTVNNNSKEGESTSQILFNNITGLGSYNSVQVSFLLGSLPSLNTGALGNGVDANETMIVETSLDGGGTWSTAVTYYGSSNYLLPLSSASPATIAYNANASYNANGANTSTQSAFVINLPSNTSQFRLRVTATDNREEENWAIDNIQVIGSTTGAGVPKPLPTATGSTYSTCTNTPTPIAVALTNTQGTTTYSWSPTTAISSTTAAGPIVSPTITTSYTVTITDADGCTVSASDAINITTPPGNIVLASTTLTAIEPSCPDATGWTYYIDPSNANNWVFGIYKNGNTFTANVDITVKSTPDVVSNSSLKKATYTMGRYWNVVLATGNINGATNPVKVRFFYSLADTTAMRSAATSQATSWGLNPSNVNGVEWFKTNTGLIYTPSSNTYSDVPNKLSPTLFTVGGGTVNGIPYVEYIGLQGFSGGTGGIRVSPGGYALPVELLYVTATPIHNDFIRLNWATASELNNDGFDIERSTDGISFEKIAFVNGHNSSSAENHYLYEDKKVLANAIYYYRLKQIDNDGKFEYTAIVSAMLLSQQGFVMDELKPNPAANQVVVNAVAADLQSAIVSVTDMLGRTVLTQEWQLSPGLNGTQLDISDLATGTYSVTVKSENGNFTKRLAVSR